MLCYPGKRRLNRIACRFSPEIKMKKGLGVTAEKAENSESVKSRNRRVHMANERTFLAWTRTSIGIIALGFVVERFAIFMRQLSFYFGREGIPPIHQTHGASRIFGIALVGIGTVMSLLSYIRFKRVTRQIDEDAYQPTSSLDFALTAVVFVVGLFLVVYLLYSL